MNKEFSNFGRNVAFHPASIHRPASTDELLEILAKHSLGSFRAFGALHAWSRAAETDDVMIDMSRFDSVKLRADGNSVFVGGGCQIKRLLAELRRKGKTLPTVGLIDEQTVAGATSTGTHGSGKHCLSHYILSVSIAHFRGGQPTITRVDRGDELLAARCALGMLGIIVEIEFECRPIYNVLECARLHETLDQVLGWEPDFPLQQFYLMPWSWKFFGHHRVETTRQRSFLAALYRMYCFVVIDVGLHVVIFGLVKLLRIRGLVRAFYRWILPLTIIRNWRVIDDSSRMLVMQHELFRHIEIEISVRRNDLAAAIELSTKLIKVFGGRDDGDELLRGSLEPTGLWQELVDARGSYQHHYPICVRRVLADETLISMSSAIGGPDEAESTPDSDSSTTDWYAISFISYQWPSERDGFFRFANLAAMTMAKLFNARCHWGKYNPLDREANVKLYPGLARFGEIVEKFDPENKFTNRWLADVL